METFRVRVVTLGEYPCNPVEHILANLAAMVRKDRQLDVTHRWSLGKPYVFTTRAFYNNRHIWEGMQWSCTSTTVDEVKVLASPKWDNLHCATQAGIVASSWGGKKEAIKRLEEKILGILT